MTIEEVKAGNEIIGEFMGWKMFSAYEILDQWESGDRCGGKSYSDIYVLNPTELFLSQEDKSFGVNIEEDEFDGCKLYDDWAYELRFYESWDWIMPVIEKISEWPLIGGESHIDTCYPITFNMPDEDGKKMFRFKGFNLYKGDTLLEAAYLSVVKFIEHNNSLSSHCE